MGIVMSEEAPTDDRALLALARSGDRSAREDLGRRIGRSAYVFALQLTGDREVASDVAQDGVVRFLDNLDRFDADRPIDPWLFQIVRNRVRDLARRDRHRRHESLDAMLEPRPDDGGRGSGPAAGPATGDRSADPAGEIERSDLQQRIWRSVSQLSESHREVFVLRDFHGLSYREIAEALSIPPGTVMSRLHAARTALRTALAEERRPGDGGDR